MKQLVVFLLTKGLDGLLDESMEALNCILSMATLLSSDWRCFGLDHTNHVICSEPPRTRHAARIVVFSEGGKPS